MSTKLKETVQRILIVKGETLGKVGLCSALGISEPTLRRWLKHGFPSAHEPYRLALACGFSEEEAVSIGRDWTPAEAKEKAS